MKPTELTEEAKAVLKEYIDSEWERRRQSQHRLVKWIIGANALALVTLAAYAYEAVQNRAVQAAHDLLAQESASFRAAATATFDQISQQMKSQNNAMMTSFNQAFVTVGNMQERNASLANRLAIGERDTEQLLASVKQSRAQLEQEKRRIDLLTETIDNVQTLAGNLDVTEVQIGMEKLAAFWEALAQSDEGAWVTAIEERVRTLESGCVDECAYRERRCNGDGYQVCGDFDSDPCSEWSLQTSSCSYGEVCVDGYCVRASEAGSKRAP